MAGRVYYATLDALSVAVVTDLFYISAPTDAVVYVEEVKITQEASEASEQLPLFLFRTTTNQDAVGTANTPNPREVGDPAFGGIVRTNIAGGSLSAETTPLGPREGQNELNGWHLVGSYDEPLAILSPVAATAGRLVIKLDAAPTAAILINGWVKLREIGG